MSDFFDFDEFFKGFGTAVEGMEGAITAIGKLSDIGGLTNTPDVADMAVQIKKLGDMVNTVFNEWATYFKELRDKEAKKEQELWSKKQEDAKALFEYEKMVMEEKKELQDAEALRSWLSNNPDAAKADLVAMMTFLNMAQDLQSWLIETKRGIDTICEGFETDENEEDVLPFDLEETEPFPGGD